MKNSVKKYCVRKIKLRSSFRAFNLNLIVLLFMERELALLRLYDFRTIFVMTKNRYFSAKRHSWHGFETKHGLPRHSLILKVRIFPPLVSFGVGTGRLFSMVLQEGPIDVIHFKSLQYKNI